MVTMINLSKEVKALDDTSRNFSEVYDGARRVILPLNPSQDNKRLRVRRQHSLSIEPYSGLDISSNLTAASTVQDQ